MYVLYTIVYRLIGVSSAYWYFILHPDEQYKFPLRLARVRPVAE